MRHALTAGTAYFLALFALGFILGTIRVLFVAPRFGEFVAVSAEVPVMLTAAFFACRWAIQHWHVSRITAIRWAMFLWFLALLFLFETILGATLFGRSASEQWASVTTPTGLVGLSAQIIAASLPLFIGKGER